VQNIGREKTIRLDQRMTVPMCGKQTSITLKSVK